MEIIQVGDKIMFHIPITGALNTLREENVVLVVKEITVTPEGYKQIWLSSAEPAQK